MPLLSSSERHDIQHNDTQRNNKQNTTLGSVVMLCHLCSVMYTESAK
jgi:hypothetical protein